MDRILCVTTMRNEGPFLIDWVAHMRAIGVTDLLVYTNDCDDPTARMLDLMARVGALRHLPQDPPPGESPQWLALRDAWRQPERKAADWALVADADEYPNIHAGEGRLADLFARLDGEAEAVALPWRLFGANGRARLEEGAVPELFTASAAPEQDFPVAATLFKAIFRPSGRFTRFGVHRPGQRRGETPAWRDGDGRPLAGHVAGRAARLSLWGAPVARGLAETNHYSLRSAESFLVKRDRGLPNRSEKRVDLHYWVERNFNTVENATIARSAARRAAERAALLSIPGLATLEEEAYAWHRARFRALLRDEAGYRLYAHCLLSAASAPVSPETARWLVARYGEIEGS